jgi:hypothetical protein
LKVTQEVIIRSQDRFSLGIKAIITAKLPPRTNLAGEILEFATPNMRFVKILPGIYHSAAQQEQCQQDSKTPEIA